jgi:integrating conjugative element protein (TIGR03757 family)
MKRGVVAILVLVLTTASVLGASQPHAAPAHLPERIDIFYDDSVSLTGLEAVKETLAGRTAIHLYDMNAPERIEYELGHGLPPDPEKSKRILMERMQAIGIEAMKQRFVAAYQGVIDAQKYGIDRYPAIVFDDGASVVYGVVDIQEALNRYRDWSAQR